MRRCWLPVLALFLLLCDTRTLVADGSLQAVDIKAAFIVNFAKFTRWPSHASSEFSLCFPTVAEPVGAQMVHLHSDVVVNEQLLEIRRGVALDELRRCRIVYLGAQDDYRRSEILGEVLGHPILTISDAPGFNQAGGMIELFQEGSKYRFSVNLQAVSSEKLEINARILGLARNLEQTQ